MKIELDKIDYNLCKALSEDGRIKMKDLSKNLNISEPTLRTRIKRLRNQGILSVRPIIHSEKFSFGITGIINIKARASELQKIRNLLSSLIEVDRLYHTMGEFDFIAIISAQDVQRFERIVSEKLVNITGIESLRTSIVLNTSKDNYGLNIRPGYGVKILCHFCKKEIIEDSFSKPEKINKHVFCDGTCSKAYFESQTNHVDQK